MKLLTSIWFPNFFAWYTQHNGEDPSPVDQYKKILDENLFSCIEMLSGVGYIDIMVMPVKRFEELLKWKAKLEEQKMKLIDENKGK